MPTPGDMPSGCQETVEVAQHRGGHAPDEVLASVGLAPGHREETAFGAVIPAMEATLVMGRVHQEGERHLEGLGDLIVQPAAQTVD